MNKLILTTILSLFTLINPQSANAILNGSLVPKDDYRKLPVVAIYVVDTNNENQLFSGVLLNSTTILTAAHCFLNKYSSVHIFRSINLYVKSTDTARIQVYENQIRKHPEYNSELDTNDLAIIKLQAAFTNSESIIYPKLDDSVDDFENYIFFGYGHDLKNKVGALNTVIKSKNTILPVRPDYVDLIKFDQTDSVGISAGDSGGPVMATDGANIFLIGINSTVVGINGTLVGSKASYVTKVSSAIDWIRSNM